MGKSYKKPIIKEARDKKKYHRIVRNVVKNTIRKAVTDKSLDELEIPQFKEILNSCFYQNGAFYSGQMDDVEQIEKMKRK